MIRTKKIVTVVVHNPSSINPSTTHLRSKPILTTIDLTSTPSRSRGRGQYGSSVSFWVSFLNMCLTIDRRRSFFSQVFAIAFQFTRKITAKFAKLDWWGLSDYDEIFCKKDKLITSKKAKKKGLEVLKKETKQILATADSSKIIGDNRSNLIGSYFVSRIKTATKCFFKK